MLTNIIILLKKIYTLGLPTITKLVYYRTKKKLFVLRYRNSSHAHARVTLQYPTSHYPAHPEPVEGRSTAQVGPITVQILGFGSTTFSSAQTITWHQDFFCPTPSPSSWATSYFADITIPGLCPNGLRPASLATQREPDIKIPWELSRLQFMHALPAQEQLAVLASWAKKNPFLYGVNWLNPMEVGIRALNIITAIKTWPPDIMTPDIKRWLDVLLVQHAHFIENTWEVSAKPNNHLLADMVGHVALCCYLDVTKYYRKRLRAWRQLERTSLLQILADGTDYEGSTAYHRLVVDLLTQALSIAQAYKLPIDKKLAAQYERMVQFLADCTDHGGNLVLIGDNDSGSVLGAKGIILAHQNLKIFKKLTKNNFHPELVEGWVATAKRFQRKSINQLASVFHKQPILRQAQDEGTEAWAAFTPACPPKPDLGGEGWKERSVSKGVRGTTYPNFGLTIIRTPRMHITFRHPTYTTRQPSGHFHQDWLSWTLSVDGTPIFIDPGTYLYTASPRWRNYFRSAWAHSTFFPALDPGLELPGDLFQLPRVGHGEQASRTNPSRRPDGLLRTSGISSASHHEYIKHGLTCSRILHADNNTITITDSTYMRTNTPLRLRWHLICAPGVTFTHNVIKKGPIELAITSSLALNIQETYCSQQYGSITPTTMLVGSTEAQQGDKVVQQFTATLMRQ